MSLMLRSACGEANIVRGAPRGPERTARIREKLSAPDALPFVTLRPGVVGMALAGLGGSMMGQESSTPRSCISRWRSCAPPRSAQELV